MSDASPAPTLLTHRKRDAILQAAIAEFRAHGFAGTSMDRVAAVAEVSKRTVYNHFPSKDELFAAILSQLWQSAQGLLAVAYDPQKALRAQLLECLEQKMRLLNDSSFLDLSRVAIAEMMQSPQRAQAMVARLSEKEEGLVTWIRAAQQDQRLRAGVDCQYAADQLQGMVKSFAFWPQLALGQPALAPAQQQRVLADCVDMFLGFYATAGRPPSAS